MASVLEQSIPSSEYSSVELGGVDLVDEDHTAAPLRGRVPAAKVLMVLNQMAVMSQNGIDLAEAVETAAAHVQHPVLADQLERIHDAISSGQSFSNAVMLHGNCFPPTFSPMLAAAEATGNVPDALERMATMIRSDLKLRSSVVGALIYPIILVSASLVVMLALVFGILPRFAEVFVQLGRPSPPLTQMLLDLGTFCRDNILLCGGAVVGFVVFAFVGSKFPMFGTVRDYVLLHAPVIRNAYRPLATGRLFRLLGSMIKGGVPLLDAIRLAKRSTSNLLVQRLLESIEDDLIEGYSASKSMSEADFLPPEAAQMLATAERTGRLSEVLCDIGVFYEEDGAGQLKKLVSLLEPLIILGMGVMVAGIVLSIMLPLLDVSTSH